MGDSLKLDDRTLFDPSRISFYPWPPKYVFVKYLELRKLESIKRFWIQNAVLTILFYLLLFWALDLAGTEDRIDLLQRQSVFTAMFVGIPGAYFVTVRDIKKHIKKYFDANK